MRGPRTTLWRLRAPGTLRLLPGRKCPHMKLTVLGSSPACANPGDASSGYLLSGEGGSLLVDCGHGVVGKLRAVAELDSLSAVLISHMHPDHIFDLVPLRYGFQFLSLPPIPLLLPPNGREALGRLLAALNLPDTFFQDTFDVREYDPSE